MAELLRGAPVAAAITGELTARVDALKARGVVPTLAIVRVGERPDDLSYERGACKRAEKVGIAVERIVLPADCTQEELLAVIDRVSGDPAIHGCLMLRPLPATIDEAAACAALDPAKDVDGITQGSLYGVFANEPTGFPPCTAEAVVELLERSGIAPPETMQLRHAVDELLAAGEPAAQEERGATRQPVAPAPQPAQTPATPLASIDARVKVLLFLAAAVAVFLSPAPWALLAWLALAFASLRVAGVGIRAATRSLRALLVLFVLVIAANVISLDGSADIMLAAPLGISVAGAERAGLAMARIIVLACLALAVGASTTPTELADAFVRLMAPLGRMGVPVGDIGLALSMALRLIPLVSQEAERIQRAQAARGVSFAGGVLKRVRAWGTVITPLVVGLFRRADRIAESMDARGIEPHAHRARPHPLTARDRLALIGGLCTMAAIVVASHLW